jgi:hypothetical protein
MTVFFVHNPNKVNKLGRLVPGYNLSDARRYGELCEIFHPTANPFIDMNALVTRCHSILQAYDPLRDYILLIGSPVFIGMAVAIAAEYGNGDVRMLQWRGSKQCYTEVQAQDLFRAQE